MSNLAIFDAHDKFEICKCHSAEYLTIIPRARTGSESIAHEAEWAIDSEAMRASIIGLPVPRTVQKFRVSFRVYFCRQSSFNNLKLLTGLIAIIRGLLRPPGANH